MKVTCEDGIVGISAISDETVDLVLTDPPYGNGSGAVYGRAKRSIMGDDSPLLALLALSGCYRVLKKNRCCLMFLDVKHLPFIRSFVECYTKFTVRDVIVWDKASIGFGSGFRKRHELILALEKGKPVYHNRGLANLIRKPRADVKSHPHAKPVELLELLIKHTTYPNECVLDPFSGSGSTAVAALQTQRDFIGFEVDEGYVALANRRLNSL